MGADWQKRGSNKKTVVATLLLTHAGLNLKKVIISKFRECRADVARKEQERPTRVLKQRQLQFTILFSKLGIYKLLTK